ncbi:MAG: AMP-binding protein [Clostridia bacterium]|nr:AMP-binding protein [Clostridia bacterium]
MSRIRRLSGTEAPPARTITDMLAQACASRPEQTAFIDMGEPEQRFTYAQFREDLLAAAGKLQALAARHIAVVCDGSYTCVVHLYAVMVAGKVLIPLDAQLPQEDVATLLTRFDADLVLGPQEDRCHPCPAISWETLPDTPGQPLTQWPRHEPDAPACIVCTSGTEGKARGVLLTQYNMAHTNNCSVVNNLKRPVRQMVYLSLHHIFTLLVVTTALQQGHEIYLSRSVKYFVRDMERVQPDIMTTIPMINEMYRSRILASLRRSGQLEKVQKLIRLSNALLRLGIDLRTLLFRQLREKAGRLPQLIVTSAAVSQPDTLRFYQDIGVIVLQCYGMTETTGSIATNTLLNNRIGSVGKPKDYCEVRIVDGEIQVRGSNVFREYYGDPAATAKVFDGEWLRTGDLGRLDHDGYLFITGRRKNLIILDSGENVSPEELEQQLTADPAIAEALVRERQGRIHAELYISAPSEISPDELARRCVERINDRNPAYKRISSWDLRDEPFEKNASMKIRRPYDEHND